MRVLPVCLNLKSVKILVVGGGKVARQKLKALLLCGGRVDVVAKNAEDFIKQLRRKGKISLYLREFRESDLRGHRLVYACTDSLVLNKRIARLAKKRKMLCNVASTPTLSSFISPAIWKKRNIIVSVTTSGKNPPQSVRIRDRIGQFLATEK